MFRTGAHALRFLHLEQQSVALHLSSRVMQSHECSRQCLPDAAGRSYNLPEVGPHNDLILQRPQLRCVKIPKSRGRLSDKTCTNVCCPKLPELRGICSKAWCAGRGGAHSQSSRRLPGSLQVSGQTLASLAARGGRRGSSFRVVGESLLFECTAAISWLKQGPSVMSSLD